jgi:hypothetical protein
LAGVFVLDLPLALGLFWIWGAYLRPAALAVVVSEETALNALAKRRWSAPFALLVVVGILLGVASHLLWDAFTHRGFWPYHHIALLRRAFFFPGHRHHLRGYEVMQLFSSVAGLGIVGIWLWSYWNEPSHGARFHLPLVWRWRLVTAVLFAVVVAVVRGLWGTRGIPWSVATSLFITEFLITSLDVLFLVWLAASMVVIHRMTRVRYRDLVDA